MISSMIHLIEKIDSPTVLKPGEDIQHSGSTTGNAASRLNFLRHSWARWAALMAQNVTIQILPDNSQKHVILAIIIRNCIGIVTDVSCV